MFQVKEVANIQDGSEDHLQYPHNIIIYVGTDIQAVT